MDFKKPVFRMGQTNFYVQPGDIVWTDRMVARIAAPGQMPVVLPEAISGRVRHDGTVLLSDGETLVPLENCRPCEKVIRI